MKKSLLLIALFQTVFIAAQAPEFIGNNVAGIFYYNVEDAINKTKVKKEKNKIKFTAALRKYNAKVKKVSFLNSFKLKELELLVNTANKNINSLEDDAKRDLSIRVQEVILPIRDSLAASEKILNASLENFLSSKQQKKWKKYQRSEKMKLIPQPKNTQNNTPPPMQNRNGRNNRRF